LGWDDLHAHPNRVGITREVRMKVPREQLLLIARYALGDPDLLAELADYLEITREELNAIADKVFAESETLGRVGLG
jgi:hypothetical protein